MAALPGVVESVTNWPAIWEAHLPSLLFLTLSTSSALSLLCWSFSSWRYLPYQSFSFVLADLQAGEFGSPPCWHFCMQIWRMLSWPQLFGSPCERSRVLSSGVLLASLYFLSSSWYLIR